MLSFLFVEEIREVFHQEIVLRIIQPCFLHGGAHDLFWYATRAAKFLLKFQEQFALYGQENYGFEREFNYAFLRGCLSKNRPLNYAWKKFGLKLWWVKGFIEAITKIGLLWFTIIFWSRRGCRVFCTATAICTSWKLKIWHFLRRCKMFDLHHLPMNFIPIYR